MTAFRKFIWFQVIIVVSLLCYLFVLYESNNSRSRTEQFETNCSADFGAIELGIRAVNLDSGGSWLKDFEGSGKHYVEDISSKGSGPKVGMPSIDPSGSKYIFEVKQGFVYVYTGHPNEKLIGMVDCSHSN